MSTQNFKIKKGLSVRENEIITQDGNITLPVGATITIGDSFLDGLPDQTGNDGKYLITDGESASWDTITQYTPPTDQGTDKFLSGDGSYKTISISKSDVESVLTGDISSHTHSAYLTSISGQSIKNLSDVYSSMSPTDGQVLTYNTTNGWQAEDVAGGASVTIDTTSPTSPSAGDLWWNSEEGRLKVYYNDGDTSQWVDAFVTINGVDGIGISDVSLTSGNHAPGTADTYTITYSDASTDTFTVYNGVDGTSSTISVTEYTATQDQTTFNATYDVGFVDVYVNGLILQTSEFTATNGTSIILDSGLNSGDEVKISSYGTFSVANVYTRTELDGVIKNQSLSKLDLSNSIDFKGAGSVTYDAPSTSTHINRYGVLETASIDEPRFNEKGMRFDASSTNLFTYSNDFTSANWGNATNTRTGGQLSPDGGNNAYLIQTVNANSCQLFQNVTLSSVNSTVTIVVKAGNRDTLTVRWVSFDTSFAYQVNITSKTSTGDVAKFEDLSNGFVKVSISTTMIGTDLNGQLYFYIATDNGTNYTSAVGNNMYVYSAQVEALPYATSYIPTTDTAVTRAQAITSFPTKNNMPDISKGAGLFVEFTPENIGDRYLGLFLQPSTSNYIRLLVSNDDKLYLYQLTNSVADFQAKSNSILSLNGTTIRACIAITESEIKFYINGELDSTVSVSVPVTTSAVYNQDSTIGVREDGAYALTGHIKSIEWVDYTPTATEIKLRHGGN
jgi:hypothetical protein